MRLARKKRPALFEAARRRAFKYASHRAAFIAAFFYYPAEQEGEQRVRDAFRLPHCRHGNTALLLLCGFTPTETLQNPLAQCNYLNRCNRNARVRPVHTDETRAESSCVAPRKRRGSKRGPHGVFAFLCAASEINDA